jgi:uncharacterized membrane protein YczE
MKKKFIASKYHLMSYLFALFTTAFGVFLMKSSTLGLGPWGVASFELNTWLNQILGFFTFGLATSIHTYIMIFIILWINKSIKSAFVFVSVLLMNGMVDVYDLVLFPQWAIDGLPSAVLSHGLGFILYCLGSAFFILSGFPGLVLEEFTFSLMKITKIKNYALVRTMVAYFGFVLALSYGYFSGSNASSITLLSFVLGVAFGPVIQWLVKTIRKTSLGTKLTTSRA